MQSNTLQALVKESKQGNSTAFKEIYDHLIDRVFSYVRSRTRTREDALDITQETFADFWKSIRNFEFTSEAKLFGYLFTIAHRKLSKHYEHFHPQVSFDDMGDIFEASDTLSADLAAEASRVIDSLEMLSEMDRQVVSLRYFSGLTFAEIAALIDQNESAVKVRHHRALEKLQKIYESGSHNYGRK